MKRLLSIILLALLPLVSYGAHDSTYEIISYSDLAGLDFSQLDQSLTNARTNNDDSEVIISYHDTRPATLSGITALTMDGRTAHTRDQLRPLLIGTGLTGWINPDE